MSNNPHVTDPIVQTHLGDNPITLLGTAHVSRKSAETVSQLIESGEYDVIAIELCESRHHALANPDSLAKMDLLQVIKEGKAAMIAANLAMGAFQQRLAEQHGIQPGAEMRAAMEGAEQANLPLELIDREIGTTLKRTAANLPWWKRWGLFGGIIGSLISKEDVSEDEIEKLKEGDMLETAFAEFAEDRQDLFIPLIAERDTFMAARLKQVAEQHPGKRILAVVGAGHLNGMEKELQRIEAPSPIVDELNQLPTKSTWPKMIPWVIVALVFLGFYLGFSQNQDLGWELVKDWIVINGTLSALGAAVAFAHPLTVLTAFVAAPITSLNPTIGAGMVTAAAELWLRKPRVSDFSALRSDTTSLRGWWKNRVSRTLLVFLFSTLGSAAGTYIAGFTIVDKLS